MTILVVTNIMRPEIKYIYPAQFDCFQKTIIHIAWHIFFSLLEEQLMILHIYNTLCFKGDQR